MQRRMLPALNARISWRLLIIHVCLAHEWESQRRKAAQHVNYVQWAKTWVTQQGMHICTIKKELGAIWLPKTNSVTIMWYGIVSTTFLLHNMSKEIFFQIYKINLTLQSQCNLHINELKQRKKCMIISINVFVSYFCHCRNKLVSKSSLREEGLFLVHGLRLPSMVEKGRRQNHGHFVCTVRKQRHECWCPANTLFVIHHKTTAHWMVPPTFRVGCPTAI